VVLIQLVDDEFVYLIACNVSHISTDAICAKDVRMDDNSFHLVIGRDLGRCAAVQSLLELETGKVQCCCGFSVACTSQFFLCLISCCAPIVGTSVQ
jgi:hypothetical protein